MFKATSSFPTTTTTKKKKKREERKEGRKERGKEG
jgi:hypothetical protein